MRVLGILKDIYFGITFAFGYKGKPKDPETEHCIDCGVQKKDHHDKLHAFRGFEV